MPSYITSRLLSDEKIIFRTTRHWVVFLPVVLWLVLTLLVAYFSGFTNILTIILGALTLITLFLSWINFKMSELAVTNLRVLVKIGWVGRYSLETNFQNIATISVDQSILGRLLGYGTINIYDTGSQRSPFAYIAHPFKFRKAVQEQLEKRYPPE